MKLYATMKSERNSRTVKKGAEEYLALTFSNKGIPIFDVMFKDDGEGRGKLEIMSYYNGETHVVGYYDI